MEYLYKVLGIKATVQRAEFDHLPNYIAVRYRLQKVSMDGQKVIFLYPKTELEQIEVLKKHIARIQKKENLPVVLVLNELSYRQKEYLLREKIPFIVDGKQIYLPFMSVYLQERCDAEKQPREDLLPSAQLLLLHFIYGGTKELPSSQAAKDLKLTATSNIESIETAGGDGAVADKESWCAENSAVRRSAGSAVSESGRDSVESGKANGLCSEGVYWGGYAGKRIFGTGRIFDAERTSRRVLCDR